jgi:MoxR-like ATPase
MPYTTFSTTDLVMSLDYTSNDVPDLAGKPIHQQLQSRAGEHPSSYAPDSKLVDAVNVALVLERPLLVTGDPGTGKTQLAHSIAWQLAEREALDVKSPRVERFETKSTSVARDLFYSFDVLGRFHAAQSKGSANDLNHITYNALGRALLNTYERKEVEEFLPPGHQHEGPRRSVVLIDEIDKAPRDFPNDLLNEIDQMFFRIAELGGKSVGGPREKELRPIVVITSNSEKALPDPFLRRCIYFNIPFPTPDRLEQILLGRLRLRQRVDGGLVKDAVEFFQQLRDDPGLRRKISPAELMQWLTFILHEKADPERPLREAAAAAKKAIHALAKQREDQDYVTTRLNAFLDKTK